LKELWIIIGTKARIISEVEAVVSKSDYTRVTDKEVADRGLIYESVTPLHLEDVTQALADYQRTDNPDWTIPKVHVMRAPVDRRG